ncbi:hypothetical protein HPB49_012486 [Dermacentor silvarum]|uniref:Uncharacterized protein n=1 Tax=Dermacentor silvarum TaxID=543639 RepID=A0ACB8D5H6_DERSI|nr:hypothetical protein HPB49_012486 [Dermacentor silvarum]
MSGGITSNKDPTPAGSSSSPPARQETAQGLSSPHSETFSPAPGLRSPASGWANQATSQTCQLPNFDTPDTLSALQESVYVVLGHGPYQRRILYCGMLCVIVVLMQELALRLVGQSVDHWCRPPQEYGHLSADQWRNQSIPVEADGSFSACTVYDPPTQPSVLTPLKTATPADEAKPSDGGKDPWDDTAEPNSSVEIEDKDAKETCTLGEATTGETQDTYDTVMPASCSAPAKRLHEETDEQEEKDQEKGCSDEPPPKAPPGRRPAFKPKPGVQAKRRTTTPTPPRERRRF